MRLVNNKYALVFFLCLTTFSAFSQSKAFEYDWEPATKHTPIPDSLLKEDAVMIFHNRFVLNDIEKLDYRYKEQIHYKIKIQTPKGLSEHAIINVWKDENAHFAGLDARTIKPNGQVIDLSSSQIKRLDYKDEKDGGKTTDLRFSIPNVAVGDEIEVLIDYESSRLPKGRDLLLQSPLVVLDAQITLKYNRDFAIDLLTYNNMPAGKYEETISHGTYRWSLQNIPAVVGQNMSSPKYEMPYVSYMLRGGKTNTNERLYRMYYANFEDKNGSTKQFMQNISRRAMVSDTLSDYGKFVAIYQYISSAFTLVNALPLEYEVKQLDVLLEKKQLDYVRYHVLLRHLFDELNLKYYVCIGRNKYRGYLDLNFIPPQAISDFFFAVKDEDGKLHLVFPGYRSFYKIDEIPTELKGTESLFIGKPGIDGSFYDVHQQELGAQGAEYNYRIRNAKMMLTENADSVRFKVKETLSGDLSTLYNNRDPKEEDKKRPKTIDKSCENYFPFTTTLRYPQATMNCMQEVGPQTFAVKLGDVVSVITSPVNTGKRILAYFPFCAYKDVNKIVLAFDKDIVSDNSAKLQKVLSNEYAGVMVSIQKTDARTMTVEITYELKALFIEAAAIESLRTINTAVTDALDSKLMVTLSQ